MFGTNEDDFINDVLDEINVENELVYSSDNVVNASAYSDDYYYLQHMGT